MEDDVYPLAFPKVYLEGYTELYSPQVTFEGTDDSLVLVRDKLINKVHDYISEVKAGDDSKYNNLQGCLVVSEQINGKFGQYRKQLIKERKNKSK